MAKRIAYVRIMAETNALSPVLTEVVDFERTHYLSGTELSRAVSTSLGEEVPGFVRNAELSGFHDAVRKLAPPGAIVTVPLFSAWAVSGGRISRACFDHFATRLADALRAALPLDGLYFALHGALGAEGEVDPEARFLEIARGILGPDVPIGCSFDLHGLLTREKMAQLDLLAAYRTNPHRDHGKTGFRAGSLLVRRVLGEITPTAAWRAIPMVLGGGAGTDFLPPTARLFRLMKQLERDPRVLDVSLFLCHFWNDHPELGWSAYVVTDNAPELAERLADQLAEGAWSVRHDPVPEFLDPAEALRKIRAARLKRILGTVCVCDASDVVGAGGTGENTNLLRAFLADAPELITYLPLRDSAVVASLATTPVGETVTVTVGGKLDPEHNPPLTVTGRVRMKVTLPAFGAVVVLDLGGVQLALTEAPPLVMKPRFYRDIGLDPWKADVCVVKSFFPFRIYFLAENRMTLYVKTRGITDVDAVARLVFAGPVHPFAELADWRPEDARRRGPRPLSGA